VVFDTILLLVSLRKSHQKRIFQRDTDRKAVSCFYTCVVPSFLFSIPVSLFAPSRCGLGRIRRCHADDYTCETHLLCHPPSDLCQSVSHTARSVAQSHGARSKTRSASIPRPTDPLHILRVPLSLSSLIPAPARPPLFLACAYMTCLPVSFLPFIQIRTICDTIYQTVTPTEKYIVCAAYSATPI
jgi:hypothetical protein